MDIKKETILRKWTIAKVSYTYNEKNLHWHPRAELCFVIDGKCTAYINGVEFEAKTGDIIVLKSADIHRYNTDDGCEVCFCTFDPSIIYDVESKMPAIKAHITKEEMVECKVFDSVVSIIDELYKEKTDAEKNYDVIAKAKIIQLYYLLARHFEDTTYNGANDVKNFEAFQRVLDYISENYANDISLTDVARVLNYSPSQVSLMFPKFVDSNFKRYLDTLRVNKAVKMLKNEDISITEVAMNCGFNNIRTFNNVFKSITGTTPSEVKNMADKYKEW